MYKKYCGVLLLLCGILFMTGCGSTFPELTEEEYDQTVEYAAGLLMRYSNNGQERLIYVDAKELKKQRVKEAKEAEKKQPTPTVVQPAEPQLPVATQTEEDVALAEASTLDEQTEAEETQSASEASTESDVQEQETASAVSDPNAVVLSSDQSKEIIPDIFLSYQGYMVTSTYPESSKSYVVTADKGKKLLVLRLDLYNASSSSQSVNMIPLNLMFQIILNGNNLGYSSVTFLPNDLSSYSGNIDSKAHESVVVLTQIDESKASKIESLGMIVSIKGNEQTVELK